MRVQLDLLKDIARHLVVAACNNLFLNMFDASQMVVQQLV